MVLENTEGIVNGDTDKEDVPVRLSLDIFVRLSNRRKLLVCSTMAQ